MKNSIFTCVLSLIFFGCKPSKICFTPSPEADTYFVVKENDTTIKEASVLSKIELYYFNKSGTEVNDPGYDDTSFVYLAQSYYPGNPDYENTGIMFLRYLAGISVDSSIDDFYLKFPDGDIDTIYLKAERVSCEQGWKEKCQCTLPVRILKYNGKAVDIDTGYHLSNGQPVYVFAK